MTARSYTVMNTLLGLHREPDPQGLLRLLLTQLAPELGRAAACCYLRDPVTDEYRLELMNDAAGEAIRRLWRAGLRAPLTLAPESAGAALARLAASGAPVQISETLPEVLTELWGEELVRAVHALLETRFVTVAPVVAAGTIAGFLALFVIDAWPVDVAAECTAHAAAALANIVERRSRVGAAPGTDPLTGLPLREQLSAIAARELNRAERYRRALSIAVIEPEATEVTDEQFRALAGHVTRTMRQPDTAGILERRRLAVILPETLAGGALAFLRRLEERAGGDLPAFTGRYAAFPQDGRTWDDLVTAAVERFRRPLPPLVPGASLRGGLRAAFPNFSGGNPTGGSERAFARWR